MIFRYDFIISELLLRVKSPQELHIPDEFRPFFTEYASEREPDILYELTFEEMQIPPEEDIVRISPCVFRYNGQIHGCCLWKNGKYIIRCEPIGRDLPCRLRLPEDFLESFCKNGKWLNYFSLERAMLPYDRIFLHSSAILHNGKAYLFSAPSGGGKSTHAALWEKYFGAKVLNGDKTIISVTSDSCRAHGGPVAGSSNIFCTASAPLAAIILLQKAPQNRIAPALGYSALLSLYSETIKSTWDSAFNSRILELLERIQKSTPIFKLECLPDQSAVECVLKYFEERKI